MADPALDLDQAKRLMDALYEPGDTFYVLAYEDKKKGGRRERRFAFDGAWTVGAFIAATDQRRWAVAASVGVFEPEGAGEKARRTEDQCVGLSAFGIDVDGKNLAALVPDARTVEEVIPEVVHRLEKVGIPPHALVRSGHGLHVYLFIERVRFADDAQRTMAKDTWFRLTQLLGGASDRYDLSSYLRVPGTVNRKGTPVRVEFIEEHTHLARRRYTLEQVAKAVEHLPSLPADKAVGWARAKRRKPLEPVERVRPSEVRDDEDVGHDPWTEHVIDTLAAIDPGFGRARTRSRSPKVEDRSGAAHHYARTLFECGFSEEAVTVEVGRSAKGLERGKRWTESTVRRAAGDGPQAASQGTHEGFLVFGDSSRAAYQVLRDPSTCGDLKPSASTGVVIARPGSKKTRNIVTMFAQAPGGSRRVAFMTAFVREALRVEYGINWLHPFGYEAVINDTIMTGDLHLPRTLVPGNLPDEVQALEGRDGNRLWTEVTLAARTDIDAGAFYINAWRPQGQDQRLEWPEDREGNPVRPAWALSDDDPALFQPHAVAKFHATPSLCVAGRSQAELDKPGACRGCAFHACRANPEPGASRSYWGDARVPILTHGAYRAHRFFKPDANDFDGLVCDEVPDFIYRTPAINVVTQETYSGEASWSVEPLDTVLRIYEKGREWNEPPAGVEAAINKLRERREVLVKLASKLRSEVQQRDRTPFENKVADFEPLLSVDDIKALAKYMTKAARAATSMEQVLNALDELSNNPAPDPAATLDEPSDELLDPLADLWDFCADAPASPVLERQEFDRGGGGSLSIVRPLNGWDDLLRGPDGSRRRLVLLDATAGIDPRYMLARAFEEEVFPSEDFHATRLVLYAQKTITTTMHRQKSAEVVATEVARELQKQGVSREARLLLVTDKSMEQGLQRAVLALQRRQPGLLPDDVRVDHFGNLRGKNEYVECDAVYFTHIFRRPEDYYLGLELLLREFKGYPRQWLTKNDSAWRDRQPEVLARSLVCDLYQDLMRIRIRHRPSAPAMVFLPTSDPKLVARIMRLMRGVTVVPPGGKPIPSPLPRPPEPQPDTEVAPVPSRGWGKPKYEFD